MIRFSGDTIALVLVIKQKKSHPQYNKIEVTNRGNGVARETQHIAIFHARAVQNCKGIFYKGLLPLYEGTMSHSQISTAPLVIY